MKKLLKIAAAAALIFGCSQKDLSIQGQPEGGVSKDRNLSIQASPEGDVVGKVTVGYQGWFSAAGDGSPVNNWAHQNLEMWPDVREYSVTYQTALNNLGNGQPAKMFSSYDQSTVDLHFQWMQQYGIDCAALQRFSGELSDGTVKAQRDGMSLKVKSAAEATGRKFYIMYDISGHQNMQTVLKADWDNTITGTLNLLASPAYARQNGKPVVCIFGMGYKGAPVPGGGDPVASLDIINFFKSKGCYVIGSIPMDWRTASPTGAFSRTNFADVYDAFDMIQPWCVAAQTGSTYQPWIQGDFDYCTSHNIDYQPGMYPGTSFHNSDGSTLNNVPRYHGDFMWTQTAVMRTVGVKSIYVAMFDELNEATSIFKVAENASQAPAGRTYVNLDADGVAVSSDFYLRLTNDIGKMIKGQIPYQATHPTPHIIGGGGPIANGTYKIINRNSGLALDATGQLTGNGTAIQQYTYGGTNNQRWIVTGLGGNIYKIVGVQSGRSLDVTGQSVTAGTKIQLYDYNGGANQQWVITPTTGGYFKVQGVQSGLVMEVPGQSTTAGTQIDQWNSDGGNNQQWGFQAP